MTQRERILAMIVLALLVLGVGGVGGYMFILSPLQDKARAEEKLQNEVDDLDLNLLTLKKAAPQIAAVKRASLPPDPSDSKDPNRTPTFTFARAEYKRLIERLILNAGITDGKPGADKVTYMRPPVTPEMAPKKPAYYTLTFEIELNKVNLWQVVDFLYGYYQFDLLHQITDISIVREDTRTANPRRELNVKITSEAIALDGVEPRTSLIPLTSSIAAVAGGPGLQAVAARRELVHLISRSTALATRTRDYSYIAWGDMFYGVVPHYDPPPPVPFELARIDNVTMTRDEMPKEVPIQVKGDGSKNAKVTARASGSLIKDGALSIDYDAGTVTIPAVDPEVADGATSKIEVVATSADGTIKRETFTVAVEPLPKPPPGPDISSAIRLVYVNRNSDGVVLALVKDNATPFRYLIEFGPKGIMVRREYQIHGKKWDEERAYRHNGKPGVLTIKDDESSTTRIFKIIAFEHNALIVCDLTPPDPPPSESPPKPAAGFRPQGGSTKPARAEAISAVAGAITAAIPKPVYYRWVGGKSLKELLDPSPKNTQRLKPDEVSEILRRVAADGPAVPIASGN
jgi:hypothetical protein